MAKSDRNRTIAINLTLNLSGDGGVDKDGSMRNIDSTKILRKKRKRSTKLLPQGQDLFRSGPIVRMNPAPYPG